MWSEERSLIVFQVVDVERFGVQKVMSGEVGDCLVYGNLVGLFELFRILKL